MSLDAKHSQKETRWVAGCSVRTPVTCLWPQYLADTRVVGHFSANAPLRWLASIWLLSDCLLHVLYERGHTIPRTRLGFLLQFRTSAAVGFRHDSFLTVAARVMPCRIMA
mgnify:CR=1 FL=1